MTTHHMFTAVEARELLEAATPGPWLSLPLVVDLIGPQPLVCLRPLRDGDSDLLAAAPDLAASVVALHAEVERLRSRISTCRYCGQSVVEGAGGHTSGCYEIKLNELKRIVALERADESVALPGWHWNQHALHWYSDDGWGIWRGQTSSWSVWLGRIKRDYADCPIDLRDSKSFPTVWDAMIAKPSLKAK